MTSPFHPLAFALIGGVSLSVLSSAPAAAVVINLAGVPYDVSVSQTSYSLSTSAFQAPPLGQMPWWGDDQLASEAASQVFNLLGPGWDANYGPVFAYGATLGQALGLAPSLADPLDQIDVSPTSGAMVRYAIASTPVPGPLPLLGATELVLWSRRLRRRIAVQRDRSTAHR
ncbi:MAG: hypothetical protein VKP63_06705 [Cyanobacteriota bacterium]|nr:hypothetical protein [Cyanobacteriota bacterium]